MASVRVQKLGAAASMACAVHCAAMPILIGMGAAGTVSWLNHKPVEWGLVLMAAAIGTVSAWKGFKTHGNRAVAFVLVAAAVGLVILTASHGSHDGHGGEILGYASHDHSLVWLSAMFGLALGGSLFVNQRLCRTCTGCTGHDHENV